MVVRIWRMLPEREPDCGASNPARDAENSVSIDSRADAYGLPRTHARSRSAAGCRARTSAVARIAAPQNTRRPAMPHIVTVADQRVAVTGRPIRRPGMRRMSAHPASRNQRSIVGQV